MSAPLLSSAAHPSATTQWDCDVTLTRRLRLCCVRCDVMCGEWRCSSYNRRSFPCLCHLSLSLSLSSLLAAAMTDSSLDSSEFIEQKCTFPIHLHPSRLGHIKEGVEEQINALLMTSGHSAATQKQHGSARHSATRPKEKWKGGTTDGQNVQINCGMPSGLPRVHCAHSVCYYYNLF